MKKFNLTQFSLVFLTIAFCLSAVIFGLARIKSSLDKPQTKHHVYKLRGSHHVATYTIK